MRLGLYSTIPFYDVWKYATNTPVYIATVVLSFILVFSVGLPAKVSKKTLFRDATLMSAFFIILGFIIDYITYIWI